MKAQVDTAEAGALVYDVARTLFPLPRSLTGDGVRETLRVVGELTPLEVTEVETATPIFDWTAPREWNLRAAWIADSAGVRIVDYAESNLHVVGLQPPAPRDADGGGAGRAPSLAAGAS